MTKTTKSFLLLFPSLGGLLAANMVLYHNPSYDDAWITFRYARNFAGGLGLVFNPGGPPTEGYTSFLHLILVASGFLAGVAPLLLVSCVNFAILIALPLLAWRFLVRYQDSPHLFQLLPIIFYVSSTAIAAQASNGMETILFAAMALIISLLAINLATSPSLGAAAGFAGCSLAAILLRPEAVALISIHIALLASQLIRSKTLARKLLPPLLIATAIVAAGLGAYVTWKASYFGYILPNSYYVKTTGGVFGLPDELFPGIAHVAKFLTSFDTSMPQTLILLTVLLAQTRFRRKFLPSKTITVHLLAPVALLLVYYTTTIHESCQFRYEFPTLLPLLFFAAALFPKSHPPKVLHGDAGRNVQLLVVLTLILILFGTRPWNYRSVPGAILDARRPTIWSAIADDISRIELPRETTLVVGAVGLLPYASDLKTLDYIGLNDNFFAGRQRHSKEEVEEYYINWHPELAIFKWPPAGSDKPGEDLHYQSVISSGTKGKYAEGLLARLHRSRGYLDFIHFVMRDLRDHYTLAAIYPDGPYCIYVRNDSEHIDRIRQSLQYSKHTVKGMDPHEYLLFKTLSGELDPY